MNSRVPSYYTGLRPFARLFATGWPVLMYHKLGPRPRGVRLKGLYVSRRLFDRQLAELRRAGFRTAPYAAPKSPASPGTKTVALTFDDGFTNVLRHGLEPLARHGFQAMQFLVADLLGGTNDWEIREGEARESLMDAAQIREWMSAGHDIGSHTLTHPRLSQIPPDQAREEISASKKKLEDLFNRPIRHFCYPFGDWNDAIAALVAEAGYETACTTALGVNTPATPPFALKRITARYQSMSFKEIKARLFRAKSR